MPTHVSQSDNYRILIIDDTPSIHEDFRKTLAAEMEDDVLAAQEAALFGETRGSSSSRTFVIDSAMQGQEGHDKVRQAVQSHNPYAMAFVDMRMPPGWDGVQTIENLWNEDPNLQVVICTAYSDYSWSQIIERLGENDRLLILKKPFDRAEVLQLAMALTQKWSLARQAMLKVDELEKLVGQRTAELRYAALHDKLTGLPNRAQLNDRLSRAVQNHLQKGIRYAALFLDFDRFKVINDSLGHSIGDLLLKRIAERLRHALEGWGEQVGTVEWTAARLGGDEFVVLLEGIEDFGDAIDVAEQLLDQLRPGYPLRGHEVYTSASIGITSSDIDAPDPDAVIRDADAAMYRAKYLGRDQYAVFDRSMHAQCLERLHLENDLRKAIVTGEFLLHYQPIIAVESGEPLGCEALLRWRRPDGQIVSPERFIPVAEETGLIIPIGAWVLRHAAEQLRAWQHQWPAGTPLFMSVNVSKRQVLETGFLQQVKRVLSETGIEPATLRLEVTESLVMDGAHVVPDILQQLKALGIGLSMDDFGTGHSSLTCLHQFSIDTLKIDRRFVSNLEHNIKYTAVVQAIIALAKNLEMRVTAEGVETEGQFAQIQALDCDSVQGYLFAKPMPADQVQSLFHEHIHC